MEKEELLKAELELAEEKLMAFKDDYKGSRWGNSSVSLYFALEHLVKALLANAGMEARSHEGVKILFSMHFIKPGAVPSKIGRYLGNLYDRRVTAEYSALRRSEFTKEEVETYLEWTVESFKEILAILKKSNISTARIEVILKDMPGVTSKE